jgi:hypothetical protein
MRIGWEKCDSEGGLITRVLGMGCRDHEEGERTHVRRELREYMEGPV